MVHFGQTKKKLGPSIQTEDLALTQLVESPTLRRQTLCPEKGQPIDSFAQKMRSAEYSVLAMGMLGPEGIGKGGMIGPRTAEDRILCTDGPFRQVALAQSRDGPSC